MWDAEIPLTLRDKDKAQCTHASLHEEVRMGHHIQIQGLIDRISKTPFGEAQKMNALLRQTETTLRALFGDSHTYLKDLSVISFRDMVKESNSTKPQDTRQFASEVTAHNRASRDAA